MMKACLTSGVCGQPRDVGGRGDTHPHHHQVSLESPVTLEQHRLEAGVSAELGHLLLHAELDTLLLVQRHQGPTNLLTQTRLDS